MSRLATSIVFLIVVSAVVLLVHRYLWARLVRDSELPPPWRQVVTAVLALLCVGLFAGPIASRTLSGDLASLGAAGAFSWLGTLFFFLLTLGGSDLMRWLWRAVNRLRGASAGGASIDDGADEQARDSGAQHDEKVLDPDRRLFFQRALSGGASAGAILAGGAGIRGASRPPEVVRVEVHLNRLPKELDGFRIVQISDLHVSATIRRPYVEQVVAIANACKPDLVALTGDFMDGSVEMLRDDMAPIATLKSRFGSYFCTGNHEYYSGADAWIAEFRRIGVRVLRNERVPINDAQAGGAGFDIAGIDDHRSARFGNGHGPNLSKALTARDKERAVVLLAHQPKAVHEAATLDVDLVLSGHTHGGQIWPFGYAVRLVQPYVAGLHKHGAGPNGTQIYVSRGTGYWGPPMRLGAPHEVTLLTLRASPAQPPS